MRKQLYIFVFLIVATLPMWAQPSISYGFQSHKSAYQELTNATVVGDSYKGTAIVDKSFDDLDIGFNFVYNDSIYKKFSIASRGYLLFGTGDHATGNPTNDGYAMVNSNWKHLIGVVIQNPFALTDSSSISYKLDGESPARVLSVQYKNMLFGASLFDTPSSSVNFQIKLYETSNKVELVFGKSAIAPDVTIYARLGLKGNSSSDFHTRKTDTDWTATTKSSSNSDYCSWSSSVYPDPGLIFSFTPPPACAAPESQPTELKLTPTTTSVNGVFKKTGTADHYLVLKTDVPALDALPENGTNYSAANTLGNGYVVLAGTDSVFLFSNNVLPNTTYYFHVFGYNGYCTSGPVYNTISPLSGQVTTAPDAPAALVIDTTSFTSIKISATNNADNDLVVVAVSNTVALNSAEQRLDYGVFGVPATPLEVGDTIEGGGKVIYIGHSSDIILNNLTENKVYFFRAWSYKNNGLYSSTYKDLSAITYAVVPYYEDYKSMPFTYAPVGWKLGGAQGFRVGFDSRNVFGQKEELEASVTSPNTTDGTLNLLTTLPIKLSERPNKLTFKVNMLQYGNYGSTSTYTNWAAKDSLNIQISVDGKNFVNAYSINSSNPLVFSSKTDVKNVSVRLDGYEGKTVKLRFYWRNQTKAKLYISPISIDPLCDVPTNVKADESSLSSNSAKITWEASAYAYQLSYQKEGASSWDTITVPDKYVILDNLESDVTYQYKLRSLCSTATSDTSEWSSTYIFATKAVSCFVPSAISAGSITYKSAVISWTGDASKYQVDYRPASASKWTSVDTITQSSYRVVGLSPETSYSYRMRSICAEGDSSVWSEIQVFNTTVVPECVAPTNLISSNASDNSVSLTWSADSGNMEWTLRYRPGNVTSWKSVTSLTDKSYLLQDLQPNTLYLWSVKATCEDSYTSGWATQESFTTATSGIGKATDRDAKVYATAGFVHVINASHKFIKRLEIYAEDGRLLQAYEVNSDENLILNSTLGKRVILLKLVGESDSGLYKLLIK
jgi:hypothetical protein